MFWQVGDKKVMEKIKWFKFLISENKWLQFEQSFEKLIYFIPYPRELALFEDSSKKGNYYLATKKETSAMFIWVEAYLGTDCEPPNTEHFSLCVGNAHFVEFLKD